MRKLMMCFFLIAVVAGGCQAWAQATSGSIGGNVRDSNGGLIPNASVDMVAQETGVITHLKTDGAGSYLGLSLPPAHYVVTVRMTGFKTATTSAFELQIDQKLHVDVSLKLG